MQMGPAWRIAFAPMRLVPRSAILAAGPVLACCLAFAGCSAEVNVGGGTEASGDELAEEIRGDYVDQTGIQLPGLTCEGVKEDVGARFNCSGHNARGVQLEVSGKVTDTEGDGFDYNWHVSKAVAPGVLYERALRRQIEAHGVALSEVRCPVQIEVEVGTKLRCVATDGNGIRRGVTIRLTNLDGGFDYEVDGEGGGEESVS